MFKYFFAHHCRFLNIHVILFIFISTKDIMCVDLKWIYALDIYSIKNNKVQMHISPWCNCNGLKRTCSGLFYQSEISLVPSFSSATPLHYLGEHYSTPLCPECPLHLAQRHTRTHTYMQDMRMHIHRWCRLLSLCSKIPWLWKCSLTLSHTHTHTHTESACMSQDSTSGNSHC